MKRFAQALGLSLNLPVLTRISTLTEVITLTEPRMLNKPDTQQSKGDDENKTPRTRWNFKRALLRAQ